MHTPAWCLCTHVNFFDFLYKKQAKNNLKLETPTRSPLHQTNPCTTFFLFLFQNSCSLKASNKNLTSNYNPQYSYFRVYKNTPQDIVLFKQESFHTGKGMASNVHWFPPCSSFMWKTNQILPENFSAMNISRLYYCYKWVLYSPNYLPFFIFLFHGITSDPGITLCSFPTSSDSKSNKFSNFSTTKARLSNFLFPLRL